MAEPAEQEESGISGERVDRLIEELWRPDESSPEPEVFALLDAARDERVFPLIRRSKLDYRCLFLGDVHPELAKTAPYVVHLARRSAFTREVLRLGWGNAWGVYFRSAAILQDLRRHFREFLQVQDESGKPFFFRFYDPRVLRVYLSTCTEKELRIVFGPVQKYFMEDEDAQSLLGMAYAGSELVEEAIPLASSP